jgi:hypothetical protein
MGGYGSGDDEDDEGSYGDSGGYPGGGYPGGGGGGGYPGGGIGGQPAGPNNNVLGLEGVDPTRKEVRTIKQTLFTVQFVWKPTPKADRLDADPSVAAEEQGAGAEGETPATP